MSLGLANEGTDRPTWPIKAGSIREAIAFAPPHRVVIRASVSDRASTQRSQFANGSPPCAPVVKIATRMALAEASIGSALERGRARARRAAGGASPAPHAASAPRSPRRSSPTAPTVAVLDLPDDDARVHGARGSAPDAVVVDLRDAGATAAATDRGDRPARRHRHPGEQRRRSCGWRRCSRSPSTTGTRRSTSTSGRCCSPPRSPLGSMIAPGRERLDRQHGQHGRQGRLAEPGPLRRVEGRGDRVHPGGAMELGPHRHHRQLHLSRLRAHRDGRGHAHPGDGRRVVGEVATRSPRRAVRRGQHGAVPRVRRVVRTAPARR